MLRNPDNTIQTPENQVPKTSISRRKFLFLMGAMATSSPVIIEQSKNVLLDALKSTLIFPDKSDKINTTIEKVVGQFSKEHNPNYKPILPQIADAISQFQEDQTQQVSYQRDYSYKSAKLFTSALNSIKDKPFYEIKTTDFATSMIQLFDDRQRQAYEASFNFFIGLQSAACMGSGFYRRLQAIFGSDLDINLTQVSDVHTYKEIENAIYGDMSDVRQHVELLVQSRGKPISSIEIFKLFLDKNNGNIGLSTMDTAIFLKFMTRNDIDNRGQFVGDTPDSVKNIRWMKKNIHDDFEGLSYTDMEINDPRIVNMIGKPYHSWFLIALLQFFPPPVIRAGCYYELFKHINEHGVDKIQADLKTLDELVMVDNLFLTAERNSVEYIKT